MTQTLPGTGLDVGRSRGMRWVWLGVAAAVLAALAWYVTHPPALSSPSEARAETPADDAVYLGVARVPADGHSAVVRSVKAGTSPEDADVRALICRDGSVGTTATLAAFCTDVVPGVGSTLESGDQLVLAVTGQEGEISIDRVAVAYRSGIQYATQPLDYTATVRILPRQGESSSGS